MTLMPKPPRTVLLALLLLLGLALPRQTQAQGYSLLDGGYTIKVWGTGYNVAGAGGTGDPLPVNTSTVEPNWKLIAFPNDFINPPLADLALPGNLYLPSRMPNPWFKTTACLSSSGGNCANTAISLAGDPDTYRWITYVQYPSAYGTVATDGSYATAYFKGGTETPPAGIGTIPATPGATPPQGYHYIIQTKFTPAVSGLYRFSTRITADNFIQAYLGGTVLNPNSATPVIIGGQFLGQNTTPPQGYHYIIQTKFTPAVSGLYRFS
ncbi:MAG: hypothetical protein ACKO3N_21355, partial [Verrucomicrobiota bacterium]